MNTKCTSGRKHGIRAVIGTIAMLLLLTLVLMTGCTGEVRTATANETPATVAAATSLYDENALVSLYQQAIPSVVMIECVYETEYQTSPFDTQSYETEGQGSGFIIDDDGYILTNNHVVEDAISVEVTLYNGDTLDAEIIGTDVESDLALVKVDAAYIEGITPLTLGDSDEVQPGQMAIALGSPYGLEGSITVGIVSGMGRSLTSSTDRLITDVIQTDAAINPGNSGGPLLNSKGEVIGINTAIEASATGIGFAVSINTAVSLLPALKAGGEVASPWLGISGVAINEEVAEELELSLSSGVYVVEVMEDSPAEEVGLRAGNYDREGNVGRGGDIITAVDDETVTSVEDLISYFNDKAPGDLVSLTVCRGGETISVEVTLGEWPEETTETATISPDDFDFGPNEQR